MKTHVRSLLQQLRLISDEVNKLPTNGNSSDLMHQRVMINEAKSQIDNAIGDLEVYDRAIMTTFDYSGAKP